MSYNTRGSNSPPLLTNCESRTANRDLFETDSLIRTRQTEHVLGDVGEDQVRRNRRHLIEPRLAKLALDVVLLGKPEAAIGLNRDVGRLPRRISSEEFRHVGFGAASRASVEELRCMEAHQVRRLDIDMSARDRELHSLVLTYRTAEYDPLFRVAGRPLDEPASVANAFGRNEN